MRIVKAFVKMSSMWGYLVFRCPKVMVSKVLLEILKGYSAAHGFVSLFADFFVSIKEFLMIIPVVFTTVGTCGVALARGVW